MRNFISVLREFVESLETVSRAEITILQRLEMFVYRRLLNGWIFDSKLSGECISVYWQALPQHCRTFI